MIIYLDPALLRDSSGTSRYSLNIMSNKKWDTALHSGMDLAVSSSHFCPYSEAEPSSLGLGSPWAFRPTCLSAGRDVSVRTTRIAPDGCYPLPCSPTNIGGVFGLSSLRMQSDHSEKHIW